MEDNKILENNENPRVIENTEDSDINAATVDTEALNTELEALAELFRTELAKTTEEYESATEEAPTENESEAEEEATEEAEEEVLVCEICGAPYKNGKDGVCEECLAELRLQPLKFKNIIVILVIGILSIVAMRGFWQNVEGYALAYEAKANFSRGNLVSAQSAYDKAISYFAGKDVENDVKWIGDTIIPRKLYFESAEVIFAQMSEGSTSMEEVANRVAMGYKDSVLPMPQYTRYKNMGYESQQLYATMQSFYDIVNKEEYQQYTVDNTTMYNSIMKEIDGIAGTTVEITTVDGKIKEMPANEAMVRFCQYMFAYSSGKTYEAQEYLAMVYETEPEYLWLYAYEYALSAINTGDMETAEKLAGELVEANRQDPDGYNLYSTIARLSGDGTKAVEWVDKALEANPQNAEVLRLKAMALVVSGDVFTAKEVIYEALSYESYGLLYYTAIVIENELGNAETVEETLSMLEGYGIYPSARLESYLAGTITAEQLFTEGTGDVE